MVELSWNAIGWVYQDGIRNLRETFEAASDGINRKLQGAYQAVDAYDAAVAAGAEPQVERDEEDHVIYDYRDILIYHTTTAEEAKGALNKALAITMFHHWERSAREWTDRAHGGFDKLKPAVESLGYPVHPMLEQLNRLVNLLKHASPNDAVKLHAVRSDFFRRMVDPTNHQTDWYEEVELSDAHIAELFEIIAASGPTKKRAFDS